MGLWSTLTGLSVPVPVTINCEPVCSMRYWSNEFAVASSVQTNIDTNQGGLPAASPEREAPWSAERQFRFGRGAEAFPQFEDFCLTRAAK